MVNIRSGTVVDRGGGGLLDWIGRYVFCCNWIKGLAPYVSFDSVFKGIIGF
ncbi:hypothetical protein Hanom_Chr07g00604101 [Helianthus anomalus]